MRIRRIAGIRYGKHQHDTGFDLRCRTGALDDDRFDSRLFHQGSPTQMERCDSGLLRRSDARRFHHRTDSSRSGKRRSGEMVAGSWRSDRRNAVPECSGCIHPAHAQDRRAGLGRTHQQRPPQQCPPLRDGDCSSQIAGGYFGGRRFQF